MVKCGNVHAQNLQTDSGAHPGVKRPGLECEHPPTSTAEIRNEWSNVLHLQGLCLHVVERDSSTFILHASCVVKTNRIKSVM
jgi:hypothetical protein